MKLGRKYRRFWLHVLPDGTEIIFWQQPRDIPALLVFAEGRWEVTRTFNREGYEDDDGLCYAFHSVPPPGARWEMCADHADKWTGWRRKRL